MKKSPLPAKIKELSYVSYCTSKLKALLAINPHLCHDLIFLIALIAIMAILIGGVI
ncbi:hypothetical protein [Methylotenera sp.]|uniref:hypothetical protein n=1 Tax=Methylotenera sp. TaxID=2051956 RepID=UPI00272333B5|nr:hypothetical protein [Methylotenera sp.]MDO9152090.1 hypothetical protein [Methylotenera sp.]MDP2230320.1 hypothetical protein [Methylotenera sp.]MDP3142303.1 hypothetical protein [Methylotenera sp.]